MIREGLEVKLCPSPDGQETFVLCRSRDRREKEKAMHARFEQRIEEGLRRIEAACRRQRLQPAVVGQRVGRLLGQNSRAAGLFQVEGERGRRPGVSPLAEGRAMAGVGRLERRLLSAPHERH